MKPASLYFTFISEPRENENKMISSASSELVFGDKWRRGRFSLKKRFAAVFCAASFLLWGNARTALPPPAAAARRRHVAFTAVYYNASADPDFLRSFARLKRG